MCVCARARARARTSLYHIMIENLQNIQINGLTVDQSVTDKAAKSYDTKVQIHLCACFPYRLAKS